jgi:hypothetical protein
VDYNLWDGDPTAGGTQHGGDFFFSPNASVLVTPEPGTLFPAAIALAGLVLLWRRRTARNEMA